MIRTKGCKGWFHLLIHLTFGIGLVYAIIASIPNSVLLIKEGLTDGTFAITISVSELQSVVNMIINTLLCELLIEEYP